MLRHRLLATVVPVALIVGACGDDDGAGVRDDASGSGSASGIADEVEGSTTDNPLVADAVVVQYTAYVDEQVDATIAATTTFTDAVRAGDLEAAKAAYAPSRQGWERIEPIAGLVEEIDGTVDARVDDFEDEDDPEFTGWHRLEYILLGAEHDRRRRRVRRPARRRPRRRCKTELADIEIPPAALAVGAVRAHRGGLDRQDHRRGGPLLAHRPVGLRRQRRGLRGGVRAARPRRSRRRTPSSSPRSRASFAELDAQLGRVRGRRRRLPVLRAS